MASPSGTVEAPQAVQAQQEAPQSLEAGQLNARKVEDGTQKVEQEAQQPLEKGQGKCCNSDRWIKVAAGVAGVVALLAVLGGLVWGGKLIVGWDKIGNISQAVGSYATLGSGAVALTLLGILAVAYCVKTSRERSEKQRELQRETVETDTTDHSTVSEQPAVPPEVPATEVPAKA